MKRPRQRNWDESPPERLEERIVVERDGSITARSGKVEFGQGIRTGFAHIVAEELNLPVARVRVELGETARVPWDMGTFGSMSTAVDGANLRSAAAFARQQLLRRAGRRLKAPVRTLRVRGGRVRAPDGRSLSFVELTAARPLFGEIPEDFELGAAPGAPPRDRPGRLEGVAIVTGTARYAADVRLPGMLYGHALRPPDGGATLRKLDSAAAAAMPGVIAIVHDDDFAGVVAERSDQALAAVAALNPRWVSPAARRDKPIETALRRDKRVADAFAGAAQRVSARYHVPHIAHAPLAPSAAVADVRDDGADIYAATQRPFGLRDDVAELLDLDPETIAVHPQMMGGMFGRGNMNDAAIEAARLSQAAKRPVLVQWTREEEFGSGPDRPILDADVEAALSPSGKIVGWRYRGRTNPHTYGWGGSARVAEFTAGRNMVPPYKLGRAEAILRVEPAVIATGSFRSLGAALHVFATESFMDELARAAGEDAIAFRLKHVGDPRLAGVLEAVRDMSGWGTPAGGGHGRGVACTIYHGTYVAEVAEVSIAGDGAVRVERVWCAVDAGRLVHPDGARNQIEGGVQQAASWTLFEELHTRNGRVVTATWKDYPIARFKDAPRAIEVAFTGDSDEPSTGVGEPGSVPTAAAIANAVFDATGVRHRDLPLGRRGKPSA